ncbi:MAG: 4-hydroxy-tetrahydrodipicolinate synthase [Candidatus Hydrogenedentota bacterium]|nr:MAG: 4-hydroxy-tetrahydrodipicolinate synthase [Candidatus Hydrogenedentota bacterium]
MSDVSRLRGSFVALVTPFDERFDVDEGALRDLVEWHIEQGTDGIVPCGTTGESATLSHEEHKRVIELVVKAVDGRVPVIAGAGSNSTRESIELTRHAADVGADFVLSITPYYNKPTQDGLVRHFQEIADAVDIPLVLYNVPGRTSVNMLPAAVAAAAQHPRIVGIKEATANLAQISEVIRSTPPDFVVLSGDDFTVLPTLAVGGRGVISVTANLVPKLNAELIRLWERGEVEKAREIHFRLLPLARACFLETNPIPVKAGVARLRGISPRVRLPLLEASPKTREELERVLATL